MVVVHSARCHSIEMQDLVELFVDRLDLTRGFDALQKI